MGENCENDYLTSLPRLRRAAGESSAGGAYPDVCCDGPVPMLSNRDAPNQNLTVRWRCEIASTWRYKIPAKVAM